MNPIALFGLVTVCTLVAVIYMYNEGELDDLFYPRSDKKGGKIRFELFESTEQFKLKLDSKGVQMDDIVAMETLFFPIKSLMQSDHEPVLNFVILHPVDDLGLEKRRSYNIYNVLNVLDKMGYKLCHQSTAFYIAMKGGETGIMYVPLIWPVRVSGWMCGTGMLDSNYIFGAEPNGKMTSLRAFPPVITITDNLRFVAQKVEK